MSYILKLLTPFMLKGAEYIFNQIISVVTNWYEDYRAKKKDEADGKEIDDAFKSPNRSDAARRLDDVIRGN